MYAIRSYYDGLPGQLLRIPCSVQPFVVLLDDGQKLPVFLGEGDVLQDAEALVRMALDLAAFIQSEVAAGDEQGVRFQRREQRYVV